MRESKKSMGYLKTAFAAAALYGTVMNDAMAELTPGTAPARDDAAAVAAICASSAPLLILDMFQLRAPDYGSTIGQPKSLDLDGDGTNDATHGDLVAKTAELSGKAVLTYGMNSSDPKKLPFSEVTNALNRIAALVQSGEMPKPSAIIFSYFFKVKLENIESGLTSDSVGPRREELAEKMRQSYAQTGNELPMYQALQNLHNMNIPLITGAGNESTSDIVNWFGMMGGITVGALTYNETEVTPYTDNNSLTTIFRVGDMIGRKVIDGIDFNNDGIADFTSDQLSGQTSAVTVLNGQPAQATTFSITEGSQTKSYEVIRRADSIAATTSDPQKINDYNRVYGEFQLAGSRLAFRKNNQGQLIFDPANNGDPDQVSLITGTSFAAPNICRPLSR